MAIVPLAGTLIEPCAPAVPTCRSNLPFLPFSGRIPCMWTDVECLTASATAARIALGDLVAIPLSGAGVETDGLGVGVAVGVPRAVPEEPDVVPHALASSMIPTVPNTAKAEVSLL